MTLKIVSQKDRILGSAKGSKYDAFVKELHAAGDVWNEIDYSGSTLETVRSAVRNRGQAMGLKVKTRILGEEKDELWIKIVDVVDGDNDEDEDKDEVEEVEAEEADETPAPKSRARSRART